MFSRLRHHLTPLLTAIALFGVVAVGGITQPALVSAAPIDVLDKCKTSSSEVCKGAAKQQNSLYALIKNIINLLLTIVGIVAVIMIIVGGIRYSTSGGSSSEIDTAKNTIIYAVVGLVIAIMAFSIVNFVLSRL
jgi:hypothetical protein